MSISRRNDLVINIFGSIALVVVIAGSGKTQAEESSGSTPSLEEAVMPDPTPLAPISPNSDNRNIQEGITRMPCPILWTWRNGQGWRSIS